jgi:hypothetical protein
MRHDEDTFDLLDRYFSGNASPAEQNLIEERLNLDENFREESELYQIGRNLVIENRLNKTSEAINNFRVAQSRKNQFSKFFYTGSALLLITAAGTTWYLSGSEEKEVVAFNGIKKEISDNSVIETSSGENITSLPDPKKSDQTEGIKIPHHETAVEITPENSGTSDSRTEEQKEDISNISSIAGQKESETTDTHSAVTDPCLTVLISGKINTIATCQDQSEGVIDVCNLKGGTAPYTIQIGNRIYNETKIRNLEAGDYMVSISDKNGCKQDLGIAKVTRKNCNAEKDLSFNPSIGQTLQILSEAEKPGVLKILSRTGQIVYRFPFSTSSNISWDGQGTDGNVKEGFYIYMIEYNDGTVENGTITIVL